VTAPALHSDLPRFGFTAPAGRGYRWLVARKFGTAVPISGRSGWEVDVRPYGRIREIPMLGAHGLRLNEELARHVLESIRTAIANGAGEEAACAPYLRKQRFAFGAKYAAWVEYVRAMVSAGERSANYLRELERYGKPGGPLEFIRNVAVFESSFGLMQDWIRWMADHGVGQNTRPKIVGAVRGCLGWLAQRGELEYVHPFPAMRKRRHIPTIISASAQDSILAEIPEDRRGAFYVAVEELVRPGEVRALNVSDYSWRSRELVIAHAMQGPCSSAARRGTKTGDGRVRAVSERVAVWLEQHVPREARLEGGRPLFVNPTARVNGKRWLANALREEWNRAAARAGLGGIKMYEGTKHSTATDLDRQGIDRRIVAAAAGHTTEYMTETYQPLRQGAVVEALRRRGSKRNE
jgi:integrase